jgi:hypothetical protein
MVICFYARRHPKHGVVALERAIAIRSALGDAAGVQVAKGKGPQRPSAPRWTIPEQYAVERNLVP